MELPSFYKMFELFDSKEASLSKLLHWVLAGLKYVEKKAIEHQ